MISREEWKELITTCDNLPETVKYSPVPPFAFTEQGVAMLSTISWKRIKEIKSFRIESELVSGKTISTNENYSISEGDNDLIEVISRSYLRMLLPQTVIASHSQFSPFWTICPRPGNGK